MTGRIPFGVLALLTVLAWVPTQAQDSAGLPPGYEESATGPQTPQSYYGIPLNYQLTPIGGASGSSPKRIYRQLPDDLGFVDEDTPLGKRLTETFRHSWFRGEYLLWNVSGPGNALLGEQTLTGVRQTFFGFSTPPAVTFDNRPNVPISPDMDFTRTGTNAINGVAGTAETPGLGEITIANLNGFRGTFGLPFPIGQVELGGFVLASGSTSSADASINIPGSLIQGAVLDPSFTSAQIITARGNYTNGNAALIPGTNILADGVFNTTNGELPLNPSPSTFITQAALHNRQLSDSTFINYDVSYRAKLTTSVWGSEGNFVIDSPDPNSPFQIRPMFGFRYMNFRDRLVQSGQYYQSADTTTIVSREINSVTSNNLYGPQVGLRAEASYSQFMVGFEPKVMLGLNTWQANLDNIHVFSDTDPGQSTLLRGTTFSPLVDLKVYGKAALSKYLSAFISYNYLWTGSVIRSYNDVTYNQNSQNNADFLLNKNYSTAIIQGLSLGVELRY